MPRPNKDAQLVYFQPAKPGPFCIGEIAAYDEADEEIPEDMVPVRWRGTVLGVPMDKIRPVG